jgi:hypothetical protein
MVQVTKLSKAEINETGFKKRSIAVRFMKVVMKKTAKDFKKKDDLIQALKRRFDDMRDFGIDLNDDDKLDKKAKKTEKTIKKDREKFVKILDDRADIEEIYTGLNVDEYLKKINYKVPNSKSFKDKSKKLKQMYYFEWKGLEQLIQNIKDLYNNQDTAYKFNISMAYLLDRPAGTHEYEYKYMSAQYNN